MKRNEYQFLFQLTKELHAAGDTIPEDKRHDKDLSELRREFLKVISMINEKILEDLLIINDANQVDTSINTLVEYGPPYYERLREAIILHRKGKTLKDEDQAFEVNINRVAKAIVDNCR